MDRRFALLLVLVGFGLGWIAAPAGSLASPDHAPVWLTAR